jgi:hypothetical protein
MNSQLSGTLIETLAVRSSDGTVTAVPRGVQVSVFMDDDAQSNISSKDMEDAVSTLKNISEFNL